jgi:uncharacterized membrane protein
MTIATEGDFVLRLTRRPGEFVAGGSELARVWPSQRVSKELPAQINDTFAVGPQRTAIQDVEYGVNQLVEVAVRALSPGVNDPFTAIMCVDQLGACLGLLAQRDIPSPYRFDDQGRLRVVAESVTFPAVADAAFHQIRQYGRSSVAVTIRLLETIARMAGKVTREEDREALLRHATLIERGSRDAFPEAADRHDVQERYQAVVRTLSERRAT